MLTGKKSNEPACSSSITYFSDCVYPDIAVGMKCRKYHENVCHITMGQSGAKEERVKSRRSANGGQWDMGVKYTSQAVSVSAVVRHLVLDGRRSTV